MNRAGKNASPLLLLIVLGERLVHNSDHRLARLHGEDSDKYCDDAETSWGHDLVAGGGRLLAIAPDVVVRRVWMDRLWYGWAKVITELSNTSVKSYRWGRSIFQILRSEASYSFLATSQGLWRYHRAAMKCLRERSRQGAWRRCGCRLEPWFNNFCWRASGLQYFYWMFISERAQG